jgi:DNA-directed RNA polymerase subunit RPC12/RpoP
MPEIGFPEIIKQIGNVKELEIKKSVKSADNLQKIEHKYCNIYLDVTVDDELLNERVVNDLIRNIQFSRKKNDYKVGETISLAIGTSTDYLKEYIETKRESISDKVSATKFEVFSEELNEENEKVFAKLYICPNKECSASLKENINKRLKKGAEVQCPYCNTKLEEANLKTITYNYKREN